MNLHEVTSLRLADQIVLANKPWVRNPEQVRTGRPKGNPETNAIRRAEALAKYKAACTEEWTSSATIIANMNADHGSCLETLRKWMKLGFVERRKSGDPAKWTRQKGFEWKFVEDKP